MTEWVSSYGGPLICMEERFLPSWKGMSGLSIAAGPGANDYERACAVTTFTSLIPLRSGEALVLGDAPMDTIVCVKQGCVLMLRVLCCEPDFDEDVFLEKLDRSFFVAPDETIDFAIGSSPLVLFDSVHPGCDETEGRCTFPIGPGFYRLLTKYSDTSEHTLVVHRFERV